MEILSKKVLVICSQVPPRVGGTPHQIKTLFGAIDAASYAIYTEKSVEDPKYIGQKLPASYYFFPQTNASRVRWCKSITKGVQIVKKEKIKILYAPTDGGISFFLGLIISLITGTPLVLHFLDIYYGNNYSPVRSLFARVLERLVIERARKVIICNEAIYEEYVRRYGKRSTFTLLINSIVRDPNETQQTPPPSHASYTILYTGNIYWAQEESIVSMCEAVMASLLPVEFHIYTPILPGRLKEKYGTETKIRFASARPDQMHAIQENADVLFVPLAWPRESRIVTMTALPGKVPECLISGQPMLIQAPPGSYLAEYATREGFASVVTSLSPKKLGGALERLLTDVPYRKQLVEHAFKTFGKNHDAQVNVKKFIEILEL